MMKDDSPYHCTSSCDFVSPYPNSMMSKSGEEAGRSDNSAKVILIGDSTVGKSSIINRYIYQKFTTLTLPTTGLSTNMKKLTLDDWFTINLHIWDTAGQEKYKSITNHYYKSSMGILLVFDLTNADSFKNIHKWIKTVRNQVTSETVMILIGNKSDLDANRVVTPDKIMEMAKEYSMEYVEVSALQNKKISLAFETLARAIRKNYFESPKLANKSSLTTNDTSSQCSSKIHIRLSKQRRTSRSKSKNKTANKCC